MRIQEQRDRVDWINRSVLMDIEYNLTHLVRFRLAFEPEGLSYRKDVPSVLPSESVVTCGGSAI